VEHQNTFRRWETSCLDNEKECKLLAYMYGISAVRHVSELMTEITHMTL
jgi:hypothetical protein